MSSGSIVDGSELGPQPIFETFFEETISGKKHEKPKGLNTRAQLKEGYIVPRNASESIIYE